MTFGVFVQVNADRRAPKSRRYPVGYVIQENGCWDWVGNTDRKGYGSFRNGPGMVRAHRYLYELHRGVIPAGLVIDHLCGNRRCVNPDHLEPVTTRINLIRGTGFTGQNARKTQCAAGHPLTPENVRSVSTRPGQRICRICRNRRARDYKRAQRRAKCRTT